jgi:hypothetical protein
MTAPPGLSVATLCGVSSDDRAQLNYGAGELAGTIQARVATGAAFSLP